MGKYEPHNQVKCLCIQYWASREEGAFDLQIDNYDKGAFVSSRMTFNGGVGIFTKKIEYTM